MTFSAFQKEFAAGKLHPAYLFTGKEDYFAETGVHNLLDRLLPPDQRTLNLTTVYGREAAILPDALITPPIFGRVRVVLVKQAQDLAGRAMDAVLQFLKNPSPDTHLIMVAGDVDRRRKSEADKGQSDDSEQSITGKLDRRSQFFKLVGEHLDAIKCETPKSRELAPWMEDYLAKFGKRLDQEALEGLLSVNWPNLRELTGELERLALMVGDQSVIRMPDIAELGGGSYAFEIYRLSDAILKGNLSGALAMLNNLRQWTTKANRLTGQIIATLSHTYQRLLSFNWHATHNKLDELKQGLSIGKDSKKNYGFNINVANARRLGRRRIEDALLRIQEADLNIKTGIRDDEIEISLLITELARAAVGSAA